MIDELQQLTRVVLIGAAAAAVLLAAAAAAAAMAEGPTLTAARLMIFCDLAWNPAKNFQAIARIHRMGQMRRVLIRRLILQRGLRCLVVQKAAREVRYRRQIPTNRRFHQFPVFFSAREG